MTAVEWLINELHKKYQGLIETSYNHIFDAAKEMEKQQIQKAFKDGFVNLDAPEKYYQKIKNEKL